MNPMSELVEICNTDNTSRWGDVVFMHGLDGNHTQTWQSEFGEIWPKWIGEDLSQVGIWCCGYPASSFEWRGTTMPLYSRAQNMLMLFQTKSLGVERPVVFVAHSLGGLLTKQMLRLSADRSVPEASSLATQTRGVVFLATPHSGSSLANLVGYLSFLVKTTVSMNELKLHEPQLLELNNWYRNNVELLKIKTLAFRETLETSAGQKWFFQPLRYLVVDANSANIGIPGVTTSPIDADHQAIARPLRNSQVYLSTKQFIEQCLTEASKVTIDREALVNILTKLLYQQVIMLRLKLNLPNYLLRGDGTSLITNVEDLLRWAESPEGPGLEKLQYEVNCILNR